jgi:DNA (cytosine-5)-methyltransferase 1
MDEAGACFSEWRILDAQYFGVPQRRRRVFLISVFDPATATRCPDPLLPVSESMRRDTETGNTARQEPASETATGLGSGREVANTISASLYHHGTVVNQDANNGHVVVDEPPILIDRGAFNQGKNAQYKPIISEDPVVPSLVARGPHAVFTKGKRPQTATDDETWDENRPAPTLNAFDQGDTRATTLIAFENSYRDAARIATEGVTNTLSAKMGTGGNNTPMVAIPIQDGRAMDHQQNGLGIGEEGAPSYTILATGGQSVAIGIQGTVIGRQDHNGPGGKGHTDEGDPMFTLTSTDRHGVVQYDGYNQRLYEDDVSVTLRIGRDSSDFIAQPAATTMAVRRLTPLECERLMGWPDDWTAGQSDTHRYKQCGNGVASPVATWIAQQLMKLDQ